MGAASVKGRVFGADASQVPVVRGWALGKLGAGHRCRDAVAYVVTELFANAVLHGSTGVGGPVTVFLHLLPGDRVCVEVTDTGGRSGSVPVVRSDRGLASSGRGLGIVDRLAVEWGVLPDGAGHRVFAILRPDDDLAAA
jgi:anti-sigma regulatory factor (Ser/Thr protein kinase)